MTKQAAVWKRILAFIFDLYLCIMLFATFFLIVEKDVPKSLDAAFNLALSPAALAAIIYVSIFMLFYHVFCEYIVGQTPGMLLFGIEVENKREKDLAFWQALVRNLFMVPVFPLTLLLIIEPLFYVFQGQRLLEYWSGTDTVQ